MGAWLVEHAPRPDLVLCSDAVRAAQTWSLVAEALARPAPEVTYAHALYLAGPGRLLDIMSSVRDDVGTLLLVGHNPGLHQLTVGLADDRGEADALARLRAKLPTGALVHLARDSGDGDWASAEVAPWRLEDFQRPKDLPQGEALDL
jgi:phosphohistidine phosphatase